MAQLPKSSAECRELVRFERRVEIDDGYGNMVGGWEAAFTRRAKMHPLMGSETVIAVRLQGVQPVLIFVRFDAETLTITSDWRAIDVRNGQSFSLKSVADMERQRRWITLMAEAGGPE